MKQPLFIAAMIGAVAFSLLATHFIYKWTIPFYTPEPQTSSISTSLEDRCDFVVKTSNFNSVSFSEPTAGTFKYELYATPDGYVEVWKCN